MPVKEQFTDVIRDFVLTGKMSFYEKGFIYTDSRLGAFVVPYTNVAKITFHVTDDRDWMEIAITEEGMDLLPANYITESVFFLIVPHEFSTEKIHKLEKIFAEMRGEEQKPKVESETEAETATEAEEDVHSRVSQGFPTIFLFTEMI